MDGLTEGCGKFRIEKLRMLYCLPDINLTWEERVSTVGSGDKCVLLNGRHQGKRTTFRADLASVEIRFVAEPF